jgi:hypothetical protein
MPKLDIKQVEQRLAEVISNKRREEIGYTLLVVLCTPVCVAIVNSVIYLIVIIVLSQFDVYLDHMEIYTGFNIFLAYMVLVVFWHSNPPDEVGMFDKAWLAAVVVFILLIVLTYATRLMEQNPNLFGMIYALVSFLVMCLLGRVPIEQRDEDAEDPKNVFVFLILVLPAFIAMSYGEITRRSWLWIPPKPDELGIAAWFLYKLKFGRDGPLKIQAIPKRILNMLIRLKFVRVRNRTLKLTLKGRDFLKAIGENELARKK